MMDTQKYGLECKLHLYRQMKVIMDKQDAELIRRGLVANSADVSNDRTINIAASSPTEEKTGE